jgi:hypothetical protein
MEPAGADKGAPGWDPPLLVGHLSGCGSNRILWAIACHIVVTLVRTTEISRGLYFETSMEIHLDLLWIKPTVWSLEVST